MVVAVIGKQDSIKINIMSAKIIFTSVVLDNIDR